MTVSRSTGLLGVLVILACSTTSVFAGGDGGPLRRRQDRRLGHGPRSGTAVGRVLAERAGRPGRSAGPAMAIRAQGVGLQRRLPAQADRAPFTAIRVRLRNQGEAFVLAAKVGDARGPEWTAGRMEQARRRVAMGRVPRRAVGAGTVVGGDCRQWPSRWPISRSSPFDIRSGAEYEVQVSARRGRAARPAGGDRAFSFPRKLVHGESYPVSLRVQLDKPCTRGRLAGVSPRQGGGVPPIGSAPHAARQVESRPGR